VKSWDELPYWPRAIATNAIAVVGVAIGLEWRGIRLPINDKVYISIFTIVLLNFMLLVVRPRIIAQKTQGEVAPNPWRVLYGSLAERPFVTALFILQLFGASRSAAAIATLMQTAASEYVRRLPDAQDVTLRLIVASAVLAGVAILSFIGAIGLWQSRRWAWWLVLVLNGLSATVSAVVQTLKWDQFLLDPLAMAVVVLLLTRPVRMEFRGDQSKLKHVSA
jgi:uncharacterized membrane protein (DUF2068 family)